MNLRRNTAAAVLAAAIVAPTATHAFASHKAPSSSLAIKPTTRTTSSSSSSALSMGPPTDPSAPLTEQFGEGSRKYRRTVYTHDQWVKHRSPDRFANNLGTLVQSGIYKQVGKEVFLTVSVAVSVCVWNALVGGAEDFSGVMQEPFINEGWAIKAGLPLEPFTLLSPSLGLLLVFRTNASYSRWDQARKFWGLNINHTRDLNRMATTWYGNQSEYDNADFLGAPEGGTASSSSSLSSSSAESDPIDPVEREYLLGQVSLMTWAFVRSMKRHLSPPGEDEEDYVAEIKARLTPEQAGALIEATHRPNRALYDLSVAIEKLPMHFVRKNVINNNLSIFEDTLGGCERLLSSPVPLFYSRHTARFLSSWLLLLPLALYPSFGNSWNHSMMIPATAFISVFLFGIEELATQLEEPFTILPMQGFCDKIGANCDEIVSWAGEGQDHQLDVQTVRRAEVEVRYDMAARAGMETKAEENEAKRIGRLGRMKERVKRRLSVRNRMSGQVDAEVEASTSEYQEVQ
mmetsp:Transcript_18509/g.33096  ORF Transcript_18509/g.33096 Transcript_18509/m.33096 type:complete len:516 (+) Transcript_18509:206-1753(+)|eukprot:CAMPEP_0196136280 /NCGR_PEP_ID=MMETSP0910-20130528/4634_1 /TAXON_ID=49265 /ORGANISM="Thalassiosira rotula, Strain GSO102" /LENGTH=515 /DNA_ID=CAMNT_0041396539 /DNA_START=133 /DNA_END=1680 /DNA_ORIENTATION=-